MTKKELRIGIIPTRREMFAHKMAYEQKNKILKKIKDFEPKYNFKGIYIDDINEEGLLMRYREAEAVTERMKQEKADAIFFPFCNFGQEEAIARVAKNLNVPVLIWGPRDGAPNGLEWRPTDSQCGMFAATKVLSRYGVTFSYIENCALDDPIFEREFAAFLAVTDAVKAFRHMRVAVISDRPKEFLSVISNEGELLEKFGIELAPCESTLMIEMVNKQLENNREGLDALLLSLNDAGLDLSRLGEKKYALAAIELAMNEFAEKNQCSAISSECWRMFRSIFGISPCFVFGDLCDRGMPAACENDVHAAIMSVLAMAAARYETPPFVADLTIRHPENNNAELLWHCGPFAKTLKRGGTGGYVAEGGQGFYEIEHGVHTIMRFDGLKGEYFIFTGVGKGIDGPVTNGNYLWLETDDWVRWEKKLMFGPYIHHVVGIPGDISAVIRETCRYIGVTFDDARSDRFVYSLS